MRKNLRQKYITFQVAIQDKSPGIIIIGLDSTAPEKPSTRTKKFIKREHGLVVTA